MADGSGMDSVSAVTLLLTKVSNVIWATVATLTGLDGPDVVGTNKTKM